MLVKVFTTLTLFIPIICMGEILPKLSQEHSNNQATSSVNFQRHDVPLAYQYSAVHPQASTTKDEYKTYAQQQSYKQNPENFRTIQYAPLIKPGELLLQNTKFNKYNHVPEKLLDPTIFTLETPASTTIKKPLEPRLEELPSAPPAINNLRENSMFQLDYIPGHNIEVLRSVNRYPAHNAVYRSYSDRTHTNVNKQDKLNYLNQYYVQPKQSENEYTTSSRNHVESTKTTTPKTTNTTSNSTNTTHPTQKPYKIPYQAPKQYYIPKPITYIVEKPISSIRAPYTKMHSLLLNVARAYSYAMSPYKNHPTGTNPNLLGQIQNFGLTNQNYNHYQPNIKATKLKAPYFDQKTVLYPVQKIFRFN